MNEPDEFATVLRCWPDGRRRPQRHGPHSWSEYGGGRRSYECAGYSPPPPKSRRSGYIAANPAA